MQLLGKIQSIRKHCYVNVELGGTKISSTFLCKINVPGLIFMNQEILRPLSTQEMTKYCNSVIIIVFYTIDLHIKHVKFCVSIYVISSRLSVTLQFIMDFKEKGKKQSKSLTTSIGVTPQ